MTASKDVRVRIAPSPTGDPHVGLAYITLFNYVFAKKHGGKLILRIEDTDRQRYSPTSQAKIIEALTWLGLAWDEGPDKGGDYGPYVQSERFGIYKKYADELVSKGKAYPCFCTAARLDEMRALKKEQGEMGGYDRHCRRLSANDVQALKDKGTPLVIRFATPEEGVITFKDEIRGNIEIAATQIDDQVLLKSDGFPTYHLANVVDDHLMRITHVIRAEEWISSTPKHVLLYQAFGWDKPEFIHMPILRNADRSKISKRKNPVSLNYYRRKGILPQAMVNFLGLMGWSFSATEETFTLADMIAKFELSHIHLGGPVFDVTKLTRINFHYLQKLDAQAFARHMREDVFSEEFLMKIHPLVADRLEVFEQFVDKFSFFFNGSLPLNMEELIPKGIEVKTFTEFLEKLTAAIEGIELWQKDSIEASLKALLAELGWKAKDFYMPIRLVATGRKDSPPLVESLEALGKEIVRFRVFDAISQVKSKNS